MIKNKDDDFLGDKITSNVKYADNEWQAQGTVDRDSVYTKEPLLDLLFEGFNYGRDEGDYQEYVARASTFTASGTKQAAYVPAKLQHDLYVVDSQYYSNSATSCVNNIFSLSTYLKKGIALANPVYDDNSATQRIQLLGLKRVANTGEASDILWENPALKNVSFFDVFKYLLPDYHLDSTITTTEKFVKILNRYRFENEIIKLSKGKSKIPLEELSLETTIGDFVETLNQVTYKVFSKAGEEDVVKEGNLADVFIEDFTIYLHNPNDIKMPFYNRGNTKVGDAHLRENEDTRTFKTRFIANSLSGNLYRTDSKLSKPVNLEKLNDILEEAIFTDFPFYASRVALKTVDKTSQVLADELFKEGKYAHLYSDSNTAYNTLLAEYTKAVDSIDTSISIYCPEVYSEYTNLNSPEQSWGIHFLNEEPTENIFQDLDKTYKLYNNVIIGYKLADTLIANRTFVGGFYYLISQYQSQVEAPITLDIPLQERAVFKGFYDCASSSELETRFTYYPTITAINALYKLGHTNGLTAAVISEKDSENKNYEFADDIKNWLSKECFIFKGNVYGDYVEELNFMQDLTPDSDVQFKSARIKATEVPYSRHQDSKYEVPYIEQTAPLINNTPDNNEGFGVYGSDALANIGNIEGAEKDANGKVTRNVTPPFIYDYDKGNQSEYIDTEIDPRIKSTSGNGQRINTKDNKGSLTVEKRLLSPTIDELWTFLKYLTESDGSGVDSGINERLPKFYGVQKSFIEDTITVKPNNVGILTNTVNPRAKENSKTIDILNWAPIATKEPELHWSPKNTDKNKDRVELQFGGYQITRYIEKIYDYEVKPFSRRSEEYNDNEVYEYNTEVSTDKNSVTGYLEKLYNSAILAFDLPEVSTESKLKSMVNVGLLYANVLEESNKSTLFEDPTTAASEAEQFIFAKTSDANLITKNKPVHDTVQRKMAFDEIANILNYHKADGVNEATSKHNHYKEYLENPKNLKEIERDLETIRQNLQTLAEFSVASFASLGYADRAQNRGTLHQLHKNAYEYLSTFIYSVNNTLANVTDSKYNVTVGLNDLETDLNNLNESLVVVDADKRVAFDDGEYEDRYLRENYDASVLDLSSNVTEHSRGRHYLYRVNETLLSEIYLAADGTWRSVHEHTVLPIVFSDH